MKLFITLHEQVQRELNLLRQKLQKRLARPSNVAWVHYLVVALGGYVFGLFYLRPPIQSIVRTYPILGSTPGVAATIAVLIITVVLVLPCVIPFLLPKSWRVWLLFFFTLAVYPLLLSLVLWLPELWVGNMSTQGFLLWWFGFSLLAGATLGIFVWPMLFILSSDFPQIFFLLWTSSLAGRTKGLFPSYEDIVQEVHKGIGDDLGHHVVEQIQFIDAIVQRKQSGINGRLQSLSLAIGALALVGLLSLLFAERQAADIINTLLALFNASIDLPSVEGITGVRLVAGLLLVIVFGALRYFAVAYRELRIMEIMGMLCVLQIAAKSPVDTQPVTYPTPVDTSTNNTVPLLAYGLVGSLVVLATLICREIRRFTR